MCRPIVCQFVKFTIVLDCNQISLADINVNTLEVEVKYSKNSFRVFFVKI